MAARAHAYWGVRGVVVDLAAFELHLGERAVWVEPALLDRLHVNDLYLAFACASASRAALDVFEAELLPVMQRAIARIGVPAGACEDVLGTLREKLFVAAQGSAPLMADYSGRGRIAAWLRTLAAHAALKVRRAQRRQVGLADAEADALPIADPELAQLRGGDAAAFRAAFDQAFAQLTREQRTLLRQYFLDGLTFESLGRMYGIHVSTAWRRLEAARTALVAAVRAQLAAALGAGASTVNGIVRGACDEASVVGVMSALRATPRPALASE
ncbi:MAG TPA: sigma-70 family RNA polymerase sigma factor [Kofleriaceae bacterium]